MTTKILLSDVVLKRLGFPPARYIKGRASLADLFKPNGRCGIYILHFANGDLYAGQALDVTRRYIQHRNVHLDIEKISFKKTARTRLDEEEQRIIQLLERKEFPLRNIIFTSIPKGESDLDLLMSPEEQDQWLENCSLIDRKGERLVDPELRRKYQGKYKKFIGDPIAKKVVEILKLYIKTGIPIIRRGEVSFWCVSCRPTRYVYSRINMFWQEVFTVSFDESELWLSLHVARSPLEANFGRKLTGLFERYSELEYSEHKYRPGGADQVNLLIPARCAKNFLTDPDVVTAIRLFNLRLMKKGTCAYGRFHCMALADRLIRMK